MALSRQFVVFTNYAASPWVLCPPEVNLLTFGFFHVNVLFKQDISRHHDFLVRVAYCVHRKAESEPNTSKRVKCINTQNLFLANLVESEDYTLICFSQSINLQKVSLILKFQKNWRLLFSTGDRLEIRCRMVCRDIGARYRKSEITFEKHTPNVNEN